MVDFPLRDGGGRTFKDEIQVAGKRRLIRIEWKNNLGTYALFLKVNEVEVERGVLLHAS